MTGGLSRPVTGPPSTLHTWIAWASYLAAVGTGLAQGARKGLADKPEWSYWDMLVNQSLAERTAEDSPLFGFLPGADLLFHPFFLLGEFEGLMVFLILAGASALLLPFLLASLVNELGTPPRPVLDLPRALVTGFAVYLGLQNNQICVQMVVLLLAGMLALARGRNGFAIGYLGLASLLKSLPLALLVYPLLLGRTAAALGAGGLAVGTSLAWVGLRTDFDQALSVHAAWPGTLRKHGADKFLEGDTPSSFGDNQSIWAVLAKAEPRIPALLMEIAVPLISLALLGLVMWVTHAMQRRPRAAWLFCLLCAWVALAAPFGRYYYVVLLVPLAWVKLDLMHRGMLSGAWTACLGITLALPVLARADGGYAIAATVALVVGLCFARRYVRLERGA